MITRKRDFRKLFGSAIDVGACSVVVHFITVRRERIRICE